MIHTIYDNTKKVQEFARTREAQQILNDNHKGNEVQRFELGDEVETTECSTYRTKGRVEEAYKMNGYWYYIIEGRAYRTKDLTKVGR